MVFTSTNHSALSSEFVITSAAILAPCLGGLLYKGLTMIFTWLSTLLASSLSAHTTVKAPALSPYSPMFLAKLCARRTSWGPCTATLPDMGLGLQQR